MRSVSTCVAAVLVVGAAVVSGCSDASTNPAAESGDAGGSIAIDVSGGTSPTYYWDGGEVMSVTILRVFAPSGPVWQVLTAGADRVRSGVLQGAIPAGATCGVHSEVSLTPGVTYRVVVTRANGGATGWREFTP